ncbi:uncharacterized protein STEHIDRAFT_160972 [Stereum hirsutum FP-91666 SS1]|uniref:uncharacterized protein n=1 Tax=Stereum hirsutum (strain FP-91666) TaxID=721885 RepID=UPI000444A158|nr:uncharacterized protein STEHIDRAFT_160972 [Stereum hirsutum FP-91666 SS1]EIM82428.1 hypothetical protein STEHIDRAFT_160972 [Stereum hirsutum FP-91666 SS1]
MFVSDSLQPLGYGSKRDAAQRSLNQHAMVSKSRLKDRGRQSFLFTIENFVRGVGIAGSVGVISRREESGEHRALMREEEDEAWNSVHRFWMVSFHDSHAIPSDNALVCAIWAQFLASWASGSLSSPIFSLLYHHHLLPSLPSLPSLPPGPGPKAAQSKSGVKTQHQVSRPQAGTVSDWDRSRRDRQAMGVTGMCAESRCGLKNLEGSTNNPNVGKAERESLWTRVFDRLPFFVGLAMAIVLGLVLLELSDIDIDLTTEPKRDISIAHDRAQARLRHRPRPGSSTTPTSLTTELKHDIDIDLTSEIKHDSDTELQRASRTVPWDSVDLVVTLARCVILRTVFDPKLTDATRNVFKYLWDCENVSAWRRSAFNNSDIDTEVNVRRNKCSQGRDTEFCVTVRDRPPPAFNSSALDMISTPSSNELQDRSPWQSVDLVAVRGLSTSSEGSQQTLTRRAAVVRGESV